MSVPSVTAVCSIAILTSPLFTFSCFSCHQKEYAAEVAAKLSDLGLFADVDNGENTLPKKIRNGEIAQYNFILGA